MKDWLWGCFVGIGFGWLVGAWFAEHQPQIRVVVQQVAPATQPEKGR